MLKKKCLFFVSSLLALISNAQNGTGIDHYTAAKFDVAIFSDKYGTLLDTVRERFTPTRGEVDIVESFLYDTVKKLNKDSILQLDDGTTMPQSPMIHKHLNEYKRQYFGYYDGNHNKILIINAIMLNPDDPDANDWLKKLIYVQGGGSDFWNIKFNLNSKMFFDFEINAHGG